MNKQTTDQQIVALYLSRDQAALAETAAHYGSRLLRLAAGFLGDERDAEECVNDTYLKAWESIPPQKPDDLFSYLARLCRCTAYNMIDKRQAQKRSAQLVELTHEMEECIPDRSCEAEESVLSQYLNDFLGTLPRARRNIFVRRYWYCESIAEIAKGMGCSESKVKTALHRTRNGLRQYLKEKGVSR